MEEPLKIHNDAPPQHTEVDQDWFTEPPRTPGYYWFYGTPYITALRPGYAGCGVGRLMLVEVTEGPNGVHGHSGGTPVLLKKWDGKTGGSQGVWSAATVPKPKTTIEKVVYD